LTALLIRFYLNSVNNQDSCSAASAEKPRQQELDKSVSKTIADSPKILPTTEAGKIRQLTINLKSFFHETFSPGAKSVDLKPLIY